MEDFKELLGDKKRCNSMRSSKLGRMKSFKMAWCVSEAIMTLHRQWCKKMLSGTVSQDGQGVLMGLRSCVVIGGDLSS